MIRYQWNPVIKNVEFEISISMEWDRISVKMGKSWYDYVGLNLYFPYIEVGRETFGFDKGKRYSIMANSEISVTENVSYTESKIQILGFGIGFSSQEGD